MPRPIKRKIQKDTGTGDEVLSYLERLRDTALERQSQLIKVAAVTVAVIAVILTVYFVYAGTVKDAKRLYYEGYKAYEGLYSYADLTDTEQAQKAVEYFEKSFEKKKFPQTLLYIANSHLRLGETEKGIGELDQLVREFPGADDIVPLALFRKGSEYLKNGEKEKALEVFSDLGSRKESPMADMALVEAAKILEDLGREEEAKSKYEAIVTNYPASPFFNIASQKTGAGVTPGIGISPAEGGGEGGPAIQIQPAQQGGGGAQSSGEAGGQPSVKIVPMQEGAGSGESSR